MNNLIGEEFSLWKFVEPPKECSAVYTWSWNAPVSRELIDRQLTEVAEAGIGGIYILPLPKGFRPDTMRTFLEPEYLSDEFFELVKYAMEKGKELGIEVWIYDEGGWPSGGACGHTMRENPEAYTTYLNKRDVSIKKGEKYLPSADTLVTFQGKKRLPEDFTAPEDMEVTEYYSMQLMSPGKRPEQIVGLFNYNHVDLTNAGVTDTFIHNTYEKYKEHVGELFGNGVSLFFTDEPAVAYSTMPKELFARFQEEYGYDIADYLYVAIDEDLQTEEERQARIDYGRLIGKLFKENYFERIADWCRQNNVLFGGHLGGEDIPDYGVFNGYYSYVDILRAMDVPGIDEIWEQIRYPYGGRAPVPESNVFYPRVAPSAARQTGKNLSLTESFGVHGDGITPDEMRYVLNYQAMRGINVFNLFGMTLGRSRRGALLERPVFCEEKPGFYHLEHLNKYVARLSYLARLGEAEGDTALYYPANDLWASKQTMKAAGKAYDEAGRLLEEKNIPFDILDDWGILEAKVTEDGLELGKAVYRHIVVPKCGYMPDEVREKIAPYLGEGEPILKVESKELRFMTRKLDSGRLYFVFNQGETPVEETLPIEIAAGKKLYRLDLASGEIYQENSACAKLLCGEIAVYLVTEEDYPTVSDEVEYTIEAQNFVPVKVKQFHITHFGVSCEEKEEGIIPDESFSGEITYRGNYRLPEEPRAGERYRVVLEDTSVSASVSLGGEKVANMGILPMRALIPSEKLAQCGEIEITVANTAANEILAKQDILYEFPKEEVGPYHDKACQYEAARPPLKFGRVKIEKLCKEK